MYITICFPTILFVFIIFEQNTKYLETEYNVLSKSTADTYKPQFI